MGKTGDDKSENSRFCIFVILITQFPAGFIVGFYLTAMNSATPAIKVFINESYTNRRDAPPSQELATLIITLAHSFLIWGSLGGALMVKIVLQKLSRKGAVLSSHLFSILGTVLMGPVAKYGQSYESLIIGRFIAGIARGLGFSIVMVVVAETTCRRRLGFFQTPIFVVILVSAGIGAGFGHPKFLGTPDLWMWIMCVPNIASLMYIISWPWLPQTPVYLLKQGKRDDGLAIFRRLRTGNAVESEFEIMESEVNDESQVQATPITTILKTPRLRFQFFTAVIAMNAVQFLGIQAIFLYSDSLLLQAGIAQEYVTFVTMGIFLESLISFAVYIPTQKKYGTKKVFIAGLFIVVVSYVLFIVANQLYSDIPWMSYLAMTSMCTLLFGIELGPQFTAFSLPAELTTATSRPTIAFYSGCLFWALGGVISSIFPYSLAAWNGYAYLPFLIISAALIPLSIFLVPETHKRSTAQIQRSFAKKSIQSSSALFNLSSSAVEMERSKANQIENVNDAYVSSM